MPIFKCKMCGGDLKIVEGTTVTECEYCCTRQTVPDGNDERKANLFNRANRLRMDNEFDKAAGVYESIVSEFPEEAEGYWGLVLCSYGIEYVDDTQTGKKIPTCNRTVASSVMDDDNFIQACENADAIARGVYREEAKVIDTLQKKIIAVVENEEPYDVFICYKETDDITKQRTEDSLIAQDIYTELIKEGYKVFFSRVTLRGKAGSEYEPYIYAALKSAKIMLAIGTKFDYYDAVWVKNEWGRFLKMMSEDGTKHLIPCYKNLDAYDIPKEFKNLQALDMGEVTFFKNLLDNVERFVPKYVAEQPSKVVEIQTNSGNSTNDALLKRAFMFLEDGDWKSANEYCEKVLDLNPECAEAYLGKLMADTESKKVSNIGSIIMQNENLCYTRKYIIENCTSKISLIKWVCEIMGLGLADAKNFVEKEPLEMTIPDEYLSRINQICELKIKSERIVETIINPVRENKNYEKFVRFANKERVAEINSYISSWENELRNKVLEDLYIKAIHKVDEATTEEELKLASSIFESISDYKDSVSRIVECEAKFEQLKEKKSRRLQVIQKKQEQYCVKSRQSCISAGYDFTVGLKLDGTVVATGRNNHGQCNVSDWTDIVSITTSNYHTVGLKSDGTVVATGKNEDGQCNVSDWTDIVAITTSDYHTVGLKSDGTVVATRETSEYKYNILSHWKDIVAVCVSNVCTVGLKFDGTVAAVGYNDLDNVYEWKDIVAVCVKEDYTVVGLKFDGTVVATGDNKYGQCNVSDWTDIVSITKSKYHTVGLKSDGTVVATGENEDGQCNVSDWTDIVAISAGVYHTVGLKSDGTVVTVGSNYHGRCNVSDWTDIVSITTSEYHTVSLKSDGTVVATGENSNGECNVSVWENINLPIEADTLEEFYKKQEQMLQERELEKERFAEKQRLEQERLRQIEQQKAQYRSAGVCQHCGGTFKGLFKKICTVCGEKKDY